MRCAAGGGLSLSIGKKSPAALFSDLGFDAGGKKRGLVYKTRAAWDGA
jgi:hypothetical protein